MQSFIESQDIVQEIEVLMQGITVIRNIKTNKEATAKGILGATFIYVFLILYIKFF